jgi:cleavage and polyadenylation specificity factor subunit 6/7
MNVSLFRFAAVTVGSEGSSRILLEKMPKREIHGQNPTVLPCNKQSLSFFEGATRKDGPMDSMPPMAAPPRKLNSSIFINKNNSFQIVL